MTSFSPFVDLLAEIDDPRRAEGKLYRLPQVVLFAIMAIVAGANSYRAIHSFIDVHLAQLRDAFGVKWRKAPAYTTIRGILRQLDPASVEAVFRRHAGLFNAQYMTRIPRIAWMPPKAMRWRPSVTLQTPLKRKMLAANERRRAKMPGLQRMRLASSAKLPSRT
jgi:hypothetical protein